MYHSRIITQLNSNREVFAQLFTNKNKNEYLWKPEPSKWCLLEIVCHLYDEEREDFRTRVKTTLENPGKLPPPIDPVGWVKARKYTEQNFEDMTQNFLSQRTTSVKWLKSLKTPKWENADSHQELGDLSAEHFLANWLAHDYLHFRQINRLQFQYLKHTSGKDLSYAGNW